jgi:hypothetical protein
MPITPPLTFDRDDQNQDQHAYGVPVNTPPGDSVVVPSPATLEAVTADPFDLETMRLAQNFAQVGVEQPITRIPVGKPSKEGFFRSHPDTAKCWVPVMLLTLKDEDKQCYLVSPRLHSSLVDEPTVKPHYLIPIMSRQGNLSIWAARLPKPDGRADDWATSGLAAAQTAQRRWTRVTANMEAQCYQTTIATGSIPDPTWPNLSMNEMASIAFRDRVIDSWDHPVLRRLRGED